MVAERVEEKVNMFHVILNCFSPWLIFFSFHAFSLQAKVFHLVFLFLLPTLTGRIVEFFLSDVKRFEIFSIKAYLFSKIV